MSEYVVEVLLSIEAEDELQAAGRAWEAISQLPAGDQDEDSNHVRGATVVRVD